MNLAALAIPAVILLLLSALLLLVTRNWRWSIAALGLQYLGAFVFVAASWAPDLAVVKLVAGWMAASILGMTCINLEGELEQELALSERLFRTLAACLVLVIVFAIAPSMPDWIPGISLTQAQGALILIGTGLLLLGLTSTSLQVVLSLLVVLSGFEILYAAVESSTLVAGLLALINLGVALMGAYLMTAASTEGAA